MSDATHADQPAAEDDDPADLETLLASVECDGDVTALMERLVDEVQAANARADKAELQAEEALRRVNNLQDEVADYEAELATLRDERDALADEVDDLRDRTGLLEQVRDAASMKIDNRAAILIQTLYNEAYQDQQSDATETATAEMDYKKAEGALGGGISRTAIYRTFDKAADLVDDTSVLRKIEEPRTSAKNTRLQLDLGNGDVPPTVAGQSIEEPTEGERT